MADSSTKVVYAALIGNILVAAAKFGAAGISGSSAMLTEAIHSMADSANQILLLVGDKRSRSPADETHAFGYGLEVYFWTFVVAVIVLLAGGVASMIEGLHHISAPKPIVSPALSLGVLALSAIFEGASLSVGYREYKRQIRTHTNTTRTVTLWKFIKLSKDPNLYESLVEDSAALIGLAFAALGVIGSVYLHKPWADGVASIAIGLLLIADSLVVAEATRSLIAGEAAAPPLIADINTLLDGCKELLNLVECKTLQLGPRTILVTLNIKPEQQKTVPETRRDLDLVTARLKAVDERIKYVFFQFC